MPFGWHKLCDESNLKYMVGFAREISLSILWNLSLAGVFKQNLKPCQACSWLSVLGNVPKMKRNVYWHKVRSSLRLISTRLDNLRTQTNEEGPGSNSRTGALSQPSCGASTKAACSVARSRAGVRTGFLLQTNIRHDRCSGVFGQND